MKPKAVSRPVKMGMSRDMRPTNTIIISTIGPSTSTKPVDIKPAGETPNYMKTLVVADLIQKGKVRMTRYCVISPL